MPVPWEALLPFALVTVMFGVSGNVLSISERIRNDGKAPRYNIDKWDEMMMERDRRLTGSFRGQTTNPVAPESFGTNSVWETEKII
ncbi:uncharacterized protein EHS24_002524 [Apiotrichum porosum]|uniref:NADH dehydrogenase [ubiquinone] 1 alpha subcomplex subunit 1 n=1 Tax=Apiotrichum porosum TaxID=105984 RepID=A0A427XGQ3_9TREE|nr:uncharacterized protein EHS24_002524 [Apiotrichum porosum]RSH78069.1 hypothetical protein EHS24_002524 [Apiotrichum porosum]